MKDKIPSLRKIKDTYTKVYRMQIAGDGDTIRTSVPREVVEREARRRDMTIREFIKNFRIEWRYNNFDGAFMGFVLKKESSSRLQTKE